MTIAMTDGRTYESSLDMLFAKDMPSREETDKQQRDKRMKEIDETMPPDMRGPPPTLFTPNEQDYYQHQEQFPKDQNDPSAWGMDEAIGRKGPAMVPLKDPVFHEVMNHMDYLIDPEGVQKAQAGPYNKDITPVPDNRPDIYEDENGLQRSRKNDATLEQFDNFSSKFAKGLTATDIELIDKYRNGAASKWTDEDQKRLQPILDAVEGQVKHLPSSISRFQGRQEYIDFYNWDGLLLDKIIKQHKALNPGRRSEDDSLPLNARPTSAELPEEKSAYQNFTDKLEELSKSLNPSFIPTAEQFRDAPWKEKLGFIIASSFMFAGPGRGPKGSLPSGKSDPLASWTEGLAEFDKANPPIIKTLEAAEKEGSQTAANLLGEYRKIDNPVVRAEFSKIVKDKIASASEGGETSPSDITNPTIRGMKEGSDWSEVITRPDGTKETVYDQAKIERLRNLVDNGLTFTEIGEKMGVSRNSVNSMVRRVRNMDAAEGDIDSQRILTKAEEAKFRRESGIHVDRIPEIRDLLKDGESLASIAKKLDIPAPSVRLLVRNNNELNSLRTTSPTSNWTPSQDKLLTRWYKDPNSDLFGTPPGLEGRSPASIEKRIKVLGLEKEDIGSEPFVPKGAVSAPEKGSGSGGKDWTDRFLFDRTKLPKAETDLEGASGISTPNKVPEKAANRNDNLQIDDPVMEAAIDKTWENFGRANRDNLPLISPEIESKLQEMNPAGLKKLKQFELEMDSKYKQPPGRRHWLSDLTEAEANKYRKLYNDIDKIRPVK